MNPEVMLYDEPTTGLDPIRADIIDRLIIKLKGEMKVTSISVTHDMKIEFMIADRIVMLYEGKLIIDISGVFVWRMGGDLYNDSLHRRASSNSISRETLVVRMSEGRAEQHNRLNDAPMGTGSVMSPDRVDLRQPGCLGQIFLLDSIKARAARETLRAPFTTVTLMDTHSRSLTSALRDFPTR